MISSETLKSLKPDTLRSIWPEIADMDEIQAGGCLPFWEKAFPDENPSDILNRCSASHDWKVFWEKTCPYGKAMLILRNFYSDGDKANSCCSKPIVYDGFLYTSPDDCITAVFRLLVENRLESENPAFFKRSGDDLMLYWPLVS